MEAEDSSILTALYPEEAKKIAQAEMLRQRQGGVRRPQEGGLLERSRERERAEQARGGMPDFSGVKGGPGGMTPQAGVNVAGIPGAPGAVPMAGPGPGSVPPPEFQRQNVPGLGQVGGAPPPGPQVPGVGTVQPPPPGAQKPQGGLPRSAGRQPPAGPAAGDPSASTPPGDPSSHEPVPTGPVSSQIDPNSIEGQYDQAAKLRQRAYGLAPDPEVMSQERQKASENFFAGAMLQAQGGRAFGQQGGQVLQQALKRQSELELDPEKELARKMRALEGEAKSLEDRAARAQNAEDKRELQRQAEEARAEQARLQREMITANKQMTYAQIAATREASRADRQERETERNRQANWRFEDNARAHFDTVTKNTREVLEQSRALTTLPADGKLSPVQQQAIVIMLNKFQDPGSVVREGEFDRVAQAQGMLQRWGNLPQKLASGQPLPPALVQDIQNAMKLYTTAAENTMKGHAADYTRLATQRGLDPNQVVTDRRWHPAPAGAGDSGRAIDVGAAFGPQAAPPAQPGVQRRRSEM